MAMHYTESKSQQQSSLAKTPFSIEDILYQNGNVAKSANRNGESEYGSGTVQLNESTVLVNHASDKNNRNNNIINSSDEYRKILHNERLVITRSSFVKRKV